MRRFVPQLGKSVTFPDDWSEDQITNWIEDQSGGGETDLVGALKHGWKSGWADTADTYSDYKDALLRLLPGVEPEEDALDRASKRLSAAAEQEGVPDTLAEKVASGIGAIPAGLLGLLPAIGVTAGATPFVGPVGGAALGFGMHGAVREQDQDIDEILKGGALGAVEGAAFGGLGKWLGPIKGLTGTARNVKALQHAAGSGAIGAGSTAVHQMAEGAPVSAEDAIASGAVMGLLGLTPLVHRGEAKPVRLGGERGVPSGTEFAPTGRTLIEQMRQDAGGGQAIRRKDIGAPGPGDAEFILKYVDAEKRPGVRELVRQGIPDEELIRRLEESGEDLAALYLKTVNKPFLEQYMGGEAGSITRAGVDQINKSMDKVLEMQRRADAAVEAGSPMAAELQSAASEAFSLTSLHLATTERAMSQAGRELAALNLLKRGMGVPEGVLLELQKRGKLDRDMIYKVAELREAGDIKGMRSLIDAVYEPTLKDKVKEIVTMGLLSSPMTWGPTGVNVISNLSYSGLRPVMKAMAVPFDAAMSAMFGTKRSVTGSDVGAIAKGTTAAFVDPASSGIGKAMGPALKAFINKIKHETTYDSSKIELTHGPAVGGKIGQVVRFPGRALEAADAFFRTIAEYQETGMIAREKKGASVDYKDVVKLAEEIKNNPLKHVMELNRIKAAGNEAVFTTSSEERAKGVGATKLIGGGAAALQQLKNRPGFGLLHYFVPFVRTPSNIAIEALKMSPFGLWEGAIMAERFKAKIAEHNATMARAAAEGKTLSPVQLKQMEVTRQNMQREIAEQFGKAAVGSAIFALVYGAAEGGNITGGGPAKYEDYQKWIEAGNQPYSMKIGNSPWISYARIEPFASIFGAAADMNEIKEVPEDEKMGRAWAAMKDNLANKTFLMGVENLAQAWANPDRYGETAWRNFSSMFLPASSAMAWAARATDPTVRMQTSTAEGFIPRMVESTRLGMQAKIPGLRQQLEPRYSVTGQPITDEFAGINAVSPFKMAPSQAPSVVESEINRLTQLGYTTPSPERRKRKVPGMAKTQYVSPEEYQVFVRTNRQAAATLERIIDSPMWERLEDETQLKIIQDVYNRYKRGSAARVRSMMRQRISP